MKRCTGKRRAGRARARRDAGTAVAWAAPRASALGAGHAPTDSPEVRRVALGFDERVPGHLKDNLHRANSLEQTR
jgi:hypothetical protein